MYRYHYNIQIGTLCIEECDDCITGVKIDKKDSWKENEIETKLIKKTYVEVMEYLEKKRANFDIPIKLNGTKFQKKVWQALLEIPYGETRTYKDIAEKIGNPKACRAVGGANNKNPIMIIVPCHRVIGANGDLVGYAGGIDIKEILLDLEKNNPII